MAFKGIDLKGINGLTVKLVQTEVMASLEVRTGSLIGHVINKITLLANKKESHYTVKLKPIAGVHDLYFILKVESKEAIGIWNTLDIGQMKFWRNKESQEVQ